MSTTTTVTALQLTEGTEVVLRGGGVLFFTDGCQMYAVPDEAEFDLV